jgi:16S rRNA (cytosine1402-N4)-methyltransferase
MIFHKPVMVKEIAESLSCKRGGIYVDGTVGGGGHAYEILERTAPNGLLIGIDLDDEALIEAEKSLRSFGERKILVKGNFADVAAIITSLNIKLVDGILLDLGVSSHQLENAERGFSFSLEAPLDMRMDRSRGFTACDLVNHFSEKELEKVIRDYGEEKMARRIARAIIKKRKAEPLLTTTDLAAVVYEAASSGYRLQRIDPATRTFQAIRIAVNNELDNLPKAIRSGIELLKRGGRFSIISFHSLEDRIVKNEFRLLEKGCVCPPDLPVCGCGRKTLIKVLTRKPVRPDECEIAVNLRARSARLRTAERI